MQWGGTQQAPAAHPPWMLVAPYGKYDPEGSYFAADQRTAASGHTSNGHHICAALLPSPPPAMSRVCIHFPNGVKSAFSTVVAAHGDSFLLHTVTQASWTTSVAVLDYFVYNSGDLAAWRWPPTLSLLPTSSSSTTDWGPSNLRGGGAEGDEGRQLGRARRHWRVVEPRVVHGLHWKVWDLLLSAWEIEDVVPLGNDGLLCWVSFDYGLLVCDVFDEMPTLRYVPYPVEYYRYMCIAAGGVVKLVNISDWFCSKRGCSDHGCDAHTWTLRTEDMEWAMDVDDSNEPWALSGQKGYARVQLVYTVASTNGGRRLLS
ncbi:hypothetical protein HU200_001315 [Digitaria exilis]|uniref:DUF1618 domain-containing protein n=1 Tax=Digitaria exilis TaxID=1010633 RepID=A0A835G0H4_9POAL|nr:hypothetical protein HU200_001315 [Digitaria exilis]